MITNLAPPESFPLQIGIAYRDAYNEANRPLSRTATMVIHSKLVVYMDASSISIAMILPPSLMQAIENLSIAKICSVNIHGIEFTAIGSKPATTGTYSSAVNHVRFDFVAETKCVRHVIFDLISPRDDIFCDSKQHDANLKNTHVAAFVSAFIIFLRTMTGDNYVCCYARRGNIERKQYYPL